MSETTENKEVSPFSSGTEAMCWLDGNCDRCVKSYKPANPDNGLPDFKASQRLVNLGMECRLKLAIDFGFVTGTVPIGIAQLVGWTEEKGWPDSCLLYSDDDNDGWKPTPRTPKEPDEQLCLPFAINDIVMNRENVLV